MNVSLLLYSKYSQNCNKLFELIQQSGIDFINTVGLQSLCIDNPDVRKRILGFTQIKVQYVPCILIIHNMSGVVEQYDGVQAFEWVQNVINSLAPPLSPEPVMIEPQQPVKPRKKVHKKPNIVSTPDTSSVSDLLDLEDDVVEHDTEEFVPPQKPKIGIRDDDGNYDFSDDVFQDPIPESRKAPPSNQKKDITQIASEMQKMREETEPKPRRVGAV